MSMSFDATVTSSNDGVLTGPSLTLALRWVYPEPTRAPSWLDETLIIGRDPTANVIFDRAQVSRRHAQIERCGALALLRDLGSKNGVHVNGTPISSHALEPGDVVRFGDVLAVVVAAPKDTDLSFRELAPGIFGGHLLAKAVEQLATLASSPLSIVLEGATGTGKERFAQLAHTLSRRTGALVSVNCAVYTQNLAGAELFGYRRGAFTGAEQAHPGHVRAAQGGTLFLDEIPELPLDVQPMLLRAIENREVLPVGEARPQPIDVRFIAATQTPLSDLAAQGRFRSDLRARLEGGIVHLPQLSACREIVPELFAAQLRKYTEREHSLSAGYVEALCLRELPLNIRELDTLARRFALQPDAGAELFAAGRPAPAQGKETLPPIASKSDRPRPALDVPGRPSSPYTDQEVTALESALARLDGNVTKAAQELGISRARAYRILDRVRKP